MGNLTLAITKVGDLLLKNTITRKKDGKSIENVRLSVPEYQRPYKWTARNAIQLLDDIIEARNNNKEVYRVGTLILHRDSDDRGHECYNIVDGQQRMITFSLLLHALYELEDNPDKRPSIEFLTQQVYDNQFSRHNIPNNMNAFRRRTDKKATKEGVEDHVRDMRRLRDFIEDRCELIVVITDDLSEAFQFFDSQNARGKTLYPHDLLKAYHLREMVDIDEAKTEQIVKEWESIPQQKLASFFGDYLYRIKEWINGDWAYKLSEQNIYKFKGITKLARTPYAQFYKGAFSYADLINSSAMPFVSGIREVNAFQLNTPIIAGNHSLILRSIIIVYWKIFKTIVSMRGSISRVMRLSRLWISISAKVLATEYPAYYFKHHSCYMWTVSVRAQYSHLGWQSAQNFVLGQSDKVNSLNIYKLIADSDTPVSLLSILADRLSPLSYSMIEDTVKKGIDERTLDALDEDGIVKNYIKLFRDNNFYIDN